MQRCNLAVSLSLTGNRAYANRSQPLEQLSRFV